MASAIVHGLIAAGTAPSDILVSDRDEAKLAAFAGEGINTGSNADAVKFGDTLILAVKPNIVSTVLSETAELMNDKLVISIAAGISIEYIKSYTGQNVRVVRTMPNTPALVGMGMTAISYEAPVTDADVECVNGIFSALGRTVIISEKLMDAAVAVSGSGPAYVFMLIDAMADGAVKEGLTRDAGIMMAAQTVMGAAKMVLETGKHPAELKDMVCSPGGTTIDAVNVLEDRGFRAAVIKAMESCADKSRRLSGK